MAYVFDGNALDCVTVNFVLCVLARVTPLTVPATPELPTEQEAAGSKRIPRTLPE